MTFSLRKFIVLASILSVLLFTALTGCSTVKKDNSSGSTSGDKNTVTLKVWVVANPTETYRLKNIEAAAEKLNEKFKEEGKKTRIKIDGKIDNGDWNNYKQKFILAVESKKAPDIILSGHEDIAPWSSSGYIVPLDTYIDKYSQFDNVYDTLWNSVTYKGKKWGIPQDVEARPIFYQKDVLKKLGWTDEEINQLPEKIKNGDFTLNDLIDLAKEAQDKGIVDKGYAFWPRPVTGSDFYMWYYDFGGKMQDESGKLVLDKQALLKEYQFFYDVTQKYGLTKDHFVGMDWDIWHKVVTSGKSFIIQGGSWMTSQWMQDYNMSEKEWNQLGYALLPAAEKGGKPVTLSHPLVYMITKQSQHKDLAAEVLAYATTPELNAKHAVTSNHIGILKGEDQVPEYKKDKFLNDITYMLDYTHYLPNNDKFGDYDEAVFRGLSAVMSGQMTPKKALNTVVADIKQKLGNQVVIQ
jgi:inositol-phosphate transport system substrate-binding protein